MITLRRLGSALIGALAVACGGAPHADVDAVFAAMQVDEARIEHAARALEDASEIGAREAAGHELCDAATDLCARAETLDHDRDADARCARARERCTRARAEAGLPTP